ncbi:MAG: Gfo/Idh/MocA family protein [Opitutaceae bacterium]
MTGPRTFGFGICGLGLIAEFHAQAIARMRGARLAGVVSRDPVKTGAFARKHGAEAATDLEDLLARPGIDIVCITTPSGAHLEPAVAAIRAGKHVVIEKPIEITLDRVDRILEAGRVAGVWVVPIFQSRFGDGARAVKASIEAGRLGRLVLASAYVKWHRAAKYYTPPRGRMAHDGGGALMNQAIHGLDLLQWFAGMPEEVFCWSAQRIHVGLEVEDTASAALKFGSGALGAVEATTAVWPGWQRRLELCGENGSVALEDDLIARWDFPTGRAEDEDLRMAKDTAGFGSGASAPDAINFLGHQRQLQDLVDALRDGREPALVGAEGRKAVALAAALYASARTGKPVRIP